MALLICPECKKKVSDKAEKCPHCGCPKDIILDIYELAKIEEVKQEKLEEDIEKEKLEQEDIGRKPAESEYIVFTMEEYVLRFSTELDQYILLRRIYEYTARRLRAKVYDYYEKSSFRQIIEHVPKMIETELSLVIDVSMEMLYDEKIRITPEAFLKKYYDDYRYDMDYDRIIGKVVEKYAEVLGEREALNRYRNLQNASRSRWQGGGFGVKGSVKGAIMAGALNAGTDFVRSFGDSAQKKSDAAYIQRKISELKDSDYVQGQIIGGAYSVVIGVFYAVLNELRQHGKYIVSYESDKYEDAKTICEAVERYETDEKRLMEGYIEAILEYPYYEKPYRRIYERVQNTIQEAKLFEFMDYFGLEMEINGIKTSEYMKIENILSEEGIENFNYDIITQEQFYIASKMIDRLFKECSYSVMMKNYNYLKLNDYVENAKDETFDYENEIEKEFSMNQYISKLIAKCMIYNYIKEHSFDGFLWVDGVKTDCEFENKIASFNYSKYVGKDIKCWLIYDNTDPHTGERGFAIFDDGIVFPGDKQVIWFKDVVDCFLDSAMIELVLKMSNSYYRFEYNFKDSKFLGFFKDKEYYIKLGTMFTEKIIKKIVNHHKELATKASNSSLLEVKAENAEDGKYCVYCGKKIKRTTKFCNYCGKKVYE